MASTTTTTLPFASSIPLNPKPTSKPRSLPTSTSHSAKFAFAAAAAANAREGRAIPEDSKNPHVLSGELRRLARLGRLPAALSLLDHLSHRGIPASTSAFSALLSSCRSLPLARHLHAHLRIHGLDTNEFLLAKLIQLYLTCGSPDDARLVLESMPASNSYVWNALLRGHVRRGGGNSFGAAADAFLAMRAAGASANEYTYSCLLKSLAGSARALAPAMATHALLFKNAFEGAPEMLMTGLMDVYFKFGRIKMAVKVFEEMPERDVVAWGAVIAGFAHKGLKTEALEHFRWMVDEGIEPNSVVVTSVVPVIAEVGARNLGQEIHGFVLKKFRDYTEFVSIHSALIDMYCKCGDMVSGRRVFYSTKDRNAVSWTALMSGYASNGRLDQALRSIIWMQREGVRPDVVAVATALPVCTQLKALREGKELHAYALKRWFLPNVSLATSLITMYAACGCLEYSRKVFDVMVTKTVRAWTALVDAYLRNGDHLSAVDVFRSMQLSKRRPDAIAITRMLSACGDVETFRLGKELHGQVLKLKMEPIPLVAAELVLMYGRCGDLKTAQRVFNRVQSKGSMTCTAIIEAYAFNHRYKEALNLFVWMLSNRFVPNNFTFDAMLKICGAAGLHDEALGIFDSMVREYNLKASEENYDCIIGLLTRAGRIREAQRFVDLKATLFNLPMPSLQSQQ